MTGNGKLDGVLVALSYSVISGSKRDPTITHQVLEEKKAADDAGSWSNKLFPPSVCGKSNCFTNLRKHLSQMRNLHYSNTFIMEDQIWRILPQKRVEFYKDVVEKQGKARAFELLEEFIKGLPELMDMAKLARGDSFRESDYPSVEDIRSTFSYTVHYRPIPSTVGLNPELFADAIHEIEQLHSQRLAEANVALVERFMAPFKTLSEQLADPNGRKLAPVFSSIMEITDMIPTLDLTGNQELVTAAAQMRDLFSKISPEMVRSDEEARKLLGTTCASVLERFGQVGVRKFA